MNELNMNEAFNRSAPFPYTLVSLIDENGNPNVIGVSWVTRTSWMPYLVAISIDNRRYSLNGLRKNKEFVLHYPSNKIASEAWYCGVNSGRNVNKIEASGLSFIDSIKVCPPTIEGCVAVFECKIVDSFITGDHTVFVGEVLTCRGDIEADSRLFATHNYKLLSINDSNQSKEL